ncbi:hypothetical protein [Desulfobacter postgatei]|uniref:hypothetical protein n=1 Tax=Desulfobacter postgatei TaxID=2293 RepID=UPI0012F9C969|nr:hypothetical protein [Desulfobacter postgatei]
MKKVEKATNNVCKEFNPLHNPVFGPSHTFKKNKDKIINAHKKKKYLSIKNACFNG